MKNIKRLQVIGILLLCLLTLQVKSQVFDEYSESWQYSDFVPTAGGGGGSVTATVSNDVLTVRFFGSWSPAPLLTGPVHLLETFPPLPTGTIPLGTIAGDYQASVVNGYLTVTYTGEGQPVDIDRFDATLTTDLDVEPGAPPFQVSDNYIRVHTPRQESSDISSFTGPLESIVETSYVDGLGRLSQTIVHHGSPTEKDVVSSVLYDLVNRTEREYLPYAVSAGTPGEKRENWQTEIKTFYTTAGDAVVNEDTYYYNKPVYERSLLNRVISQGAPGETWRSSGDHTVDFTYTVNNATDAVEDFIVLGLGTLNQTDIVHNGQYSAGSLTKQEITDENNGEDEAETIEFTNTLGQTVLKRAKVATNDYLSTYYIYDQYGNLAYVVPPAAVKEIEGNGNDWDMLNQEVFQQKWMFSYQYDHRNRMVAKRVPGSGWYYMAYDRYDRLVLVQDANMRSTSSVEAVNGDIVKTQYEGVSYQLGDGASVTLQDGFTFGSTGNQSFKITSGQGAEDSKWIFTKYDHLNRPVMTGFFHSGLSHEALQDLAGSSMPRAESFTGSNDFEGYSNVAFPTGVATEDLLTVTYFDEYGFTDEQPPVLSHDPSTVLLTERKGLTTGSKVRVLGTDQLLETAIFYDQRFRPNKVVSENHKGGKDIVTTTYRNLVSSLVATTNMVHTIAGGVPLEVIEAYGYDHMDRLLDITQQVNDGEEVTLVANSYNELGELATKTLGVNAQAVNYRYNIRGWLTHINDVNEGPEQSNNRFAMELLYDNAGSGNAQFNGNIGKVSWRTQGGDQNPDIQNYTYGYDPLSRLKEANYYSQGKDGHFSVSGLQYDANGNIQSLSRKKDGMDLDILTYHYEGNQLTRVEDAADDLHGFKDQDSAAETHEYTYDENGNMASDANKGIVSITYNHLNLPEMVTMDNGNTVQYVYDALGMKLQKRSTAVIEGTSESVVTTTDYIAGKHYQNGVLEFFQHQEGRVLWNDGNPTREYHLTDHLGNVRVTIDETGEGVQRQGYYPFGLTYNKWTSTTPRDNYTFNGKEEQKEWDVIDYGSRMHDPALGRWFNIDDETERGPNWSPYNYTFNNPIRYIDPDGNWPWEPKAVRTARKISRQLPGSRVRRIHKKNSLQAAVLTIGDNSNDGFGLSFEFLSRNGRFPTAQEYIDIRTLVFNHGTDYSFLFENYDFKILRANPGVLVIQQLITIGILPPGVLSSSGKINKEALYNHLLNFAQHGKNNNKLDDDEVARLNDILSNPDASKKEKNAAKQKLKAHEKATQQRHSRQSNDKKKKGKKRRRGGNNEDDGTEKVE